MYRKESCPTLLSFDSDEDNEDIESDARKLRWHKVIFLLFADLLLSLNLLTICNY
jgi:transcription elongation factor SPT6